MDDGTDADATIDPANGNIYLPVGTGSIWVAGLDRNGDPLWFGYPTSLVYDYFPGYNNRQHAVGEGCLSHDGATYYFETVSQQGDGALYAINTADGSVKWQFATASTGWEFTAAAPIVTPNGVIIVGNNDGGVYYALQDAGNHAVVLDTFQTAGGARIPASLSADGMLYLPLRTNLGRRQRRRRNADIRGRERLFVLRPERERERAASAAGVAARNCSEPKGQHLVAADHRSERGV